MDGAGPHAAAPQNGHGNGFGQRLARLNSVLTLEVHARYLLPPPLFKYRE
jgi:hypothetical protein